MVYLSFTVSFSATHHIIMIMAKFMICIINANIEGGVVNAQRPVDIRIKIAALIESFFVGCLMTYLAPINNTKFIICIKNDMNDGIAIKAVMIVERKSNDSE